jgi:peptide/nickel transport system ATP-binding protein
MSLLEVTGLRTEIDTRQGRIRPVDGVSFSVAAGETLGVVGESGSGKTMTGMSIMRLLPPGGQIAAGSVRLDGQELTELSEAEMRTLRGNRMAMIFQDPMTSLNPVRTIGSQLREAYRLHRGGSRAAATARATDVLGLVGMPRPRERLGDYPHQLSGGMRQRVMIALGLMCEPGLLIADEPTTALDVSIQAQILTLIDDLKSQLSMGVLLVTHDMGVIAEYADRVAVMYGGRMVEQAGVRELFARPRHRYTQALLAAMPTLELDRSADLATIPGAPPKLLEVVPQCRFAPRCAFAQDDCRSADPVLVEADPGHLHACFHPSESRQQLEVAASSGRRKESGGGDSLVQLFDVHKRFGLRRQGFGPKRAVHAVSGVSLTIVAGETFGIVRRRQDHDREDARRPRTTEQRRGHLRRPRPRRPGPQRTAPAPARPADDVPGLRRRPRSTDDGGRLDRGAARCPGSRYSAGATPDGGRAPGGGRTASGSRSALSARVLRRSATADRDGAGPGVEAEGDRRRRTGLGAGRLGAGADPQPDALTAGPVRPDVRGHLS